MGKKFLIYDCRNQKEEWIKKYHLTIFIVFFLSFFIKGIALIEIFNHVFIDFVNLITQKNNNIYLKIKF
jgi:hypothetical protein